MSDLIASVRLRFSFVRLHFNVGTGTRSYGIFPTTYCRTPCPGSAIILRNRLSNRRFRLGHNSWGQVKGSSPSGTIFTPTRPTSFIHPPTPPSPPTTAIQKSRRVAIGMIAVDTVPRILPLWGLVVFIRCVTRTSELIFIGRYDRKLFNRISLSRRS